MRNSNIKRVYNNIRKPVYEYKCYKSEVAERYTIISWFLLVWCLNIAVQYLVDYSYIHLLSLLGSSLACFGVVTLLIYSIKLFKDSKENTDRAVYKNYLKGIGVFIVILTVMYPIIGASVVESFSKVWVGLFAFYDFNSATVLWQYLLYGSMSILSLFGLIKLLGSISLIDRWKKADRLYKKHDKFIFKNFEGTTFECLEREKEYNYKDVELIKYIEWYESVDTASLNNEKDVKSMVFTPFKFLARAKDFVISTTNMAYFIEFLAPILLIGGLLVLFFGFMHILENILYAPKDKLEFQHEELQEDFIEETSETSFLNMLDSVNKDDVLQILEYNLENKVVSGQTIFDLCDLILQNRLDLYIDVVREGTAKPHRVGIYTVDNKVEDKGKANYKIIETLYKDSSFKTNLVYDYSNSEKRLVGVEAILQESNSFSADIIESAEGEPVGVAFDSGGTGFTEVKLGSFEFSGDLDTVEEIKYVYGLDTRYTSGKEIKELADLLHSTDINMFMEVKEPSIALNVNAKVGKGLASDSYRFWDDIKDDSVFITTVYFDTFLNISHITAVME